MRRGKHDIRQDIKRNQKNRDAINWQQSEKHSDFLKWCAFDKLVMFYQKEWLAELAREITLETDLIKQGKENETDT